jgi:hypothetical protein
MARAVPNRIVGRGRKRRERDEPGSPPWSGCVTCGTNLVHLPGPGLRPAGRTWFASLVRVCDPRDEPGSPPWSGFATRGTNLVRLPPVGGKPRPAKAAEPDSVRPRRRLHGSKHLFATGPGSRAHARRMAHRPARKESAPLPITSRPNPERSPNPYRPVPIGSNPEQHGVVAAIRRLDAAGLRRCIRWVNPEARPRKGQTPPGGAIARSELRRGSS